MEGKATEPEQRRRRQKSRHHRSKRPKGRWGHVYAALDLGTNNCRLLVAKPTPDGFRVIDAFSRIVRLGEGLSTTGRLSDAAMDRCIDALKVCAEKMHRRGVTRFRNVATEACRRASNGEHFIERVLDETGLNLDIITTHEEASLAVAGCLPLITEEHDHALVFDIGGGSTELMWMDVTTVKGKRQSPSSENSRTNEATQAQYRPGVRNRIRDWISIPCGVVTLSESFANSSDSTLNYSDMVKHVQRELSGFEEKNRIQDFLDTGKVQILGTSGTVTTLAGIELGLERYERSKVDGRWIATSNIRQISQELASMDVEQRASNPCVGRERADLVVAGCAILEGIINTWGTDRVRVADRGLREGILLALMRQADKEEEKKRRSRRKSKAKSQPVTLSTEAPVPVSTDKPEKVDELKAGHEGALQPSKRKRKRRRRNKKGNRSSRQNNQSS